MTNLVLLSGGLDSACLLWHTRAHLMAGQHLKAMFIDYGQKNAVKEFEAARRLCASWNVPLLTVECPTIFNGIQSAILKNTSIKEHNVGVDELPNRNAVLISIAAAHIPSSETATILVAAHKTGAAYADATRLFYSKMSRLIHYSTNARVSVEAPFIKLTKYGLTRLAYQEGMNREEMESTVSCYEGNSCGACPACLNRKYVLEKLFY